MLNYQHKSKQGSAIITALMVVTLVAAIVSMAILHEQLLLRETSLFINSDKMYTYSQGVTSWAQTILTQSPHKTFPINMPTDENFHGATINGVITDAQARFNINLLSRQTNKISAQRLLQALIPDADWYFTSLYTDTMVRWFHYDKGFKYSEYPKLKPPYQPSGTVLTNTSEFRLIEGLAPPVFQPIYQQIKPYITALPVDINEININTAKAPVIETLLEQYMPIKTISQCLQHFRPFTKASGLADRCKFKIINKMKPTIESHYFHVLAKIELGKQSLRVHSLIYRYKKKGKYQTTLVWQYIDI